MNLEVDYAEWEGRRLATVVTSIRLEASEVERIKALRSRLQARQDRVGPRVRVTTTMVILEALDALEKRLDDLERKR